MQIKTKEDRRDRIKFRIRKRMAGTTEKPRLTVFRSGAHIYVQVVDDRVRIVAEQVQGDDNAANSA